MVRLTKDDGRHNSNSTQVTDLSINTIPRAKNWSVYARTLSAVAELFAYIPNKPNEAPVDSFICYRSYLYLFQFTVSEDHEIQDGLIPISKMSI